MNMSGTIEQLHAKVDQVLAILAQLSAGNANAQPGTGLPATGAVIGAAGGPQPSGLPATTGASPSSGLDVLGGASAGLGGGAPVYPPATAEQITALITPHVGDPNLKAALQQQMAAMGIAALPDAQPHQYGELNHRFTQVIQQFQAAAAQVQQPIVPASII
jgi:hypothetical protein